MMEHQIRMKESKNALLNRGIVLLLALNALLLIIIGILIWRGGIQRVERPDSTVETFVVATETTVPETTIFETTAMETVAETTMEIDEVVYEEDLILSGEIGMQVQWIPKNMEDCDLAEIRYHSLDSSIVTIDDSGVLTSVSRGAVYLSASCGSLYTMRKVVVKPTVAEDDEIGEDAVPITSVEDLRKISENLSGNYVLTEDIQISLEDDFAPIGSGGFLNKNWVTEQGFSGTLDGDRHIITLEFQSYRQCSGLFATIAPTGVVKNLTIRATIRGEKADDNNALGAIAGYNAGTIRHCQVTLDGEAAGKYAMLGGIAGANAGTIEYCTSYGTLSASGSNATIGGIVGLQYPQGSVSQNISVLENENQKNMIRLCGYDLGATEGSSPVGYTIRSFDDSPKQNDGQVILQHSFQQVVLQGTSGAISQVNANLADNCQKWMAMLSEETIESVYTNPVYEPNSRFWTATSQITTNDGQIFSIRVKCDWFGGGVRNINYYGRTYDLKTGKELTLGNILDLPEEQALEKAKVLALDYFHKSNTAVYEDDLANCTEADMHYYLLNGELVIVFDTYAISSGAAGSIHAPTGFFFTPVT